MGYNDYNKRNNQQFKGIPANFYYENVYQTDSNKANYGRINVKNDLEPFLDYLNKSINNLKESAQVGAKCCEVKSRTILKPTFTLLKIGSSNYVASDKPEGNYYIIEWNSEWGDIDCFEALVQRRATICEHCDIVDIYNGRILFKLSQEIDCSQDYSLYLENHNDAEKCYIKKLDYSNISEYRVEIDNCQAKSCCVSGEELHYFYDGDLPESIKLFDKLTCSIKTSNELNSDEAYINGEKAMPWIKSGYFTVKQDLDDNLLPLYLYGEKIGYEKVSKEIIIDFINDKRVVLKDRKFEVVDMSIGNIDDVVEYSNLKFKITELGDKLRRKFASHGSMIVELMEDDSVNSEVYSNVSYFFKETTEFLTCGNKRYRIGSKFEDYNQLEIIESVKGQYKKVDECPVELFVEPNVRQLQMQKNALNTLINRPNKYHEPLLRLMEDVRFCNWENNNWQFENINRWYRLTNESYEGCDDQRELVKKALSTKNFAILEGPPGSGKTTTILEIIAQMIMRGQKVLLAASTNAAIDNILERIEDLPSEVKNKLIPVRIGNDMAISESVEDYTVGKLGEYRNEVLDRANLVCGTIIGVLNHPNFKLGDMGCRDLPVAPLYDCLIVDEASKTTFQEFLVPALYAKKWILSGDLKQLTPYIDSENIEASLGQIKGFDVYMQKAQSILMTLDKEFYARLKDGDRAKNIKFCYLCDAKMLNAVSLLTEEYSRQRITMLAEKGNEKIVGVDEFLQGDIKSVLIYGCNILFVEKSIYSQVAKLLPKEFVVVNNDGVDYSDYQNAIQYRNIDTRILNSNVKRVYALKTTLNKHLKNKTWAGEISWRLCRMQELFMLDELGGGGKDTCGRYEREIQERIPNCARDEVQKTISLLKEIALPSILQLLQKGITDKTLVKRPKQTTFNSGFEKKDLDKIHVLVKYQHRMHNDISAFSANEIYNREALYNGNTINREWNYAKYESRALWIDVKADSQCVNMNNFEADKIMAEVKDFIEFAKKNPKPDGNKWSIACLTYYRKQENVLKEKMQRIFRQAKSKSYYSSEEMNVEVMVYTIDKFQGKEADLVFLSMIKSGQVGLGFMDSPNRLNVALTRAKYQIVIVGDKSYFKSNKCNSKLLQKVAEEY